jgi:hypothetical protein
MDPFALDGRSLDTDLLILRSLFAIDSNTNLPVSTTYILGTDGRGGLDWQSVFTNISSASGLTNSGVGYLPSTIYSFSTSILSLSSVQGVGFSSLSTSIGLGGIPGSITGPQLQSTVSSIFSPPVYVSPTMLISSVDSFINGNFAYPQAIQSTAIGLATFGYISASQLQSSIFNFQANSISAITSTTRGLGTVGYISSAQLLSTTAGLARYGYVSTAQLLATIGNLSTIQDSNALSTHVGLGTLGYVSTQTFLSSTDGLIRNINVDRAGNLIVYNSRVTISSLENLAFLSSFTNSSITYKGVNGIFTASTVNRDIYFSTAQLQFASHSNFITQSTQISVDIFPTFVFTNLNLVNVPQIYALSTMVQYKKDLLSNITNTNFFVATGIDCPNCNVFQQTIRMSLIGQQIQSNYDEEYVLLHRVPDSLSFALQGGIQLPDIQVLMPSTNSLYITLQNNPV